MYIIGVFLPFKILGDHTPDRAPQFLAVLMLLAKGEHLENGFTCADQANHLVGEDTARTHPVVICLKFFLQQRPHVLKSRRAQVPGQLLQAQGFHHVCRAILRLQSFTEIHHGIHLVFQVMGQPVIFLQGDHQVEVILHQVAVQLTGQLLFHIYSPKNDLIIVVTTTKKIQEPNQAAATLLVSWSPLFHF